VWLFLTSEDAIRICEQERGDADLEDYNLLDSAIARPQNYVAYTESEPDICVAAAHLLYGLAANHAFKDGNKRVALRATGVFLMLNGFELVGEDNDVYSLAMDVADEQVYIDVPQIAERLRTMIIELELPEE